MCLLRALEKTYSFFYLQKNEIAVWLGFVVLSVHKHTSKILDRKYFLLKTLIIKSHNTINSEDKF